MDALELLKHDHDEVRKLLEGLGSTTERARRGRIDSLACLKQELTAHEAIEEELFYPTLQQHAEVKRPSWRRTRNMTSWTRS